MTAALRRFVVLGGAGNIGSHFVEHLLGRGAEQVTVYDNFSSGRRWHLADVVDDPRLRIEVGDVGDLEHLLATVAGHDTLIHLASAADIAAAATNPAMDFEQGTVLTYHVAEAARRSGVELVLYASSTTVYGDLGGDEAHEDHGPMLPISTMGASKLAGEALLCSYAAMFDVSARCYRFGNVVGPRQVRGVGFDFVRGLHRRPDPTAHPRRRATDQVVCARRGRHHGGHDWRGVGGGAIRGVQRRDRGVRDGHGGRRAGSRGARAAGQADDV